VQKRALHVRTHVPTPICTEFTQYDFSHCVIDFGFFRPSRLCTRWKYFFQITS